MSSSVRRGGDELFVESLYAQGFSPDEIAGRCGLSYELILRILDGIVSREIGLVKRSAVDVLLRRLDYLEMLYRRAAWRQLTDDESDGVEEVVKARGGASKKDGSDVKALQGIERCLELRMRLFDMTTAKSTSEGEAKESELLIDLESLSHTTIRELLEGVKMVSTVKK